MGRFVAIAEVVKAVGLKGEIKLYPLLDFHAPLLDTAYLRWESGGSIGFDRWRPAGNCVAALPEQVRDRNGAEALIGRVLGFDSEAYDDPAFPRPPEGLPFRYLGREVVTRAGETVGEVDEVRFTGRQYLLVIPPRDGTGPEILIPAVAPILVADDGVSGPLVIDPPEGLLDVQSG